MKRVGRPFSSAYLAAEATARAFIPLDFRSPVDRAARTRAAAERQAPAAVIEALRAQQAELAASSARAAALDALAAGGAAVVVTGQQVGLFLGPLYGFYKAASAIAVARALQADTGVPCVPLFWLQTEDHDFAEVASVTIATAEGPPQRLSLAVDPARPGRASIAHRTLGVDVADCLAALAETLGDGAAAAETVAILGRHYRPGRPMAAAFAGAMAELFADEGLLFLDPRRESLALLAAPIHREAIAAAGPIAARLEARGAELARAGFDLQIPLRADCALTFFHPDGPEGDRFRLARARGETGGAADGWRLAGRDAAVEDAAIEAALSRTPLRFSTSALLRPILQDTLLPTAAYVGGPAELSYFAQLGPLYEAFGLALPLVVPRARFRCLDSATRRRLESLGLDADDVGRPRAALAPKLAGVRAGGAPGPREIAATVADRILPLVDQLAAEAAAIDADDRNLGRAATRTSATVARALRRLSDRVARVVADRDAVALARLARVEAALAPGGIPQERAYGWPSLAGRHGPHRLKRLVFERLEEAGPFATGLLDLRP